MRQRDISLDVVRCIACIMVVLMHSPMPNIGTSAIILSTDSLLTAPCIGLFFMVSGALLLPMKEDTKTFLTRRFSKILFPTVFWSLFYISVGFVYKDVEFSWSSALHQILSIPFSAQGHGIIWFMYTLAGLYLVTPIISPWLKVASKSQIQLYLILWLITMCYPVLKYVVEINNSITGPLYYLSGYIGYFVLGYYLKRYQPHIPKMTALLLLAVPLAIAVVCKLKHIEVDFYSLFWYLSIFTVMMCVAWFSLITQSVRLHRIGAICRALIIRFSNYSFGIYLVHIFIMHRILWSCKMISNTGGVLQICITTVLTLTISYFVISLIAKLPCANYIIGYKTK